MSPLPSARSEEILNDTSYIRNSVAIVGPPLKDRYIAAPQERYSLDANPPASAWRPRLPDGTHACSPRLQKTQAESNATAVLVVRQRNRLARVLQVACRLGSQRP